MITINKDESNTVILELTSVSNLLVPYYLFKFTNDMTTLPTYFTGTDLSTYKCRYNRFNIVETGSTYENLTASTVSLISGSYTYDIYESTTPTIDVAVTTGIIISTGKVIVSGVDVDIPSIYR